MNKQKINITWPYLSWQNVRFFRLDMALFWALIRFSFSMQPWNDRTKKIYTILYWKVFTTVYWTFHETDNSRLREKMRTIEGTSIYSKRLGKTYLNVESFMLEKVFHLALLMSHIEMQFKGREKKTLMNYRNTI